MTLLIHTLHTQQYLIKVTTVCNAHDIIKTFLQYSCSSEHTQLMGALELQSGTVTSPTILQIAVTLLTTFTYTISTRQRVA